MSRTTTLPQNELIFQKMKTQATETLLEVKWRTEESSDEDDEAGHWNEYLCYLRHLVAVLSGKNLRSCEASGGRLQGGKDDVCLHERQKRVRSIVLVRQRCSREHRSASDAMSPTKFLYLEAKFAGMLMP